MASQMKDPFRKEEEKETISGASQLQFMFYAYFSMRLKKAGLRREYFPKQQEFIEAMDMSLTGLKSMQGPILTFFDVMICMEKFCSHLIEFQKEGKPPAQLYKAIENKMAQILGSELSKN